MKIYLIPVLLWLVLAGCAAPGTKAFQREQSFQSSATNALSFVQKDIIPYVPPPYMGIVEGACAVAVAGLGLWGRSLHKRLDAHEASAPKTGPPALPPS